MGNGYHDKELFQQSNGPMKDPAALTRGAKQSSAARRGTENPPCVLVSEAVSVLQNMCSIRDFFPVSPSSTMSSSP
jgi:hypothetical protein